MHNLLALVTLAMLLLFFWMAIRVGGARAKFKVDAPATTGHPEFERHFRVQANTQEGLVVMLPALWIFALALDAQTGGKLGDEIGAALGLVWIVGRAIYMTSYVKDPSSRSAGFGIQALATMVALLGAFGVVAWSLATHGI
ncbi:MAPEG family protein [Phenylobacterium montanum]|uniref:MAPEG family protein n=1 Tax=Phenylobacterium montanum TaxID=2823693 RepID=A0A975ITK2_9CAUL|nr:MAPEG family protein [Caulobacter sp. S6]QUD86868.1 MAPEG family protein [Caulobacter sp. S6]